MKIDEARNRVVDMFCNLQNGYIDNLTYGGGNGDIETETDIHALEEVIAALDWYREQDLIRREDAKNAMPFDSTELFNRLLSYLEEIPKAEY